MKRIFLPIFFSFLANLLLAQSGHKKIKIITDSGTILIRLYDETPKHRDNFLKLVKKHFYDGLLFHRVIKDFMIQGGDPDSKNAKAGAQLGNGDVGYTIPAEFNEKLFHKKGVLAAARDNNPEKASSGCQFYIVQGKVYSDSLLNVLEEKRMNGKKFSAEQRAAYTTVGGTPWLDMNYTVFGEVISGMEVIDRIAAMKTDANDRPLTDIHMKIKRKKFLFF
jgi:peptidyl-prolyl cis-trans isomerase B (cyclophilin B)